MEEFSVDRFEGNYAVCVSSKTQEILNIEIEKLPNNIKEGDIIILENGIYRISEDKTKDAKKRIEEKMKKLQKTIK